MGVVLEDLWRVKVVVRREQSVWQLARLLQRPASALVAVTPQHRRRWQRRR
jgi:hypothetical protein